MTTLETPVPNGYRRHPLPTNASHALEAHRELLDAYARHLTHEDIARERGISIGSINQHARALYRFLGVSDRYAAVQAGIARGLIEPPPPPPVPSAEDRFVVLVARAARHLPPDEAQLLHVGLAELLADRDALRARIDAARAAVAPLKEAS